MSKTLVQTVRKMVNQAIESNADEMVLKLDNCGTLDGWNVYIRVGKEQVKEKK